MVLRTVLFGLLIAACMPGTAAEPMERGGFIAAGGGRSLFDDDGAFGGFAFDDTDTLLHISGGYKFFKYFAVEGQYNNYGSFTVAGNSIDASAVSVHAVGIVPFGTSGWEIFGQMGLGSINFDLGGLGDDDQTALAGGFGARFHPAPNFSLGIRTDVLVWEDDSLATTYDMGLGGTVLSLQFLF